MSTSSKQKPLRIPHSRTKSGCLPCRRRRKKCDEEKPICSGCTRNQLICSWPPDVACENDEADTVFLGAEDAAQVPLGACEDGPVPDSTGNVLAVAVSPLPAVFRNGTASQLLDYFMDITAPRMVGGTQVENPFITYNIRISTHCTSLQHAILAVGSCHLAYSDPTFVVPSREHYAVAVRSLKLGITKWKTSSMTDRMALLAASLTLCWYEVIDANIEGSLYHHLRASGMMIHELQRDKRHKEDDILGFFVEQYSYLAIVANISVGRNLTEHLLEPNLLCRPLKALNNSSSIYGFMFGRAHQLYEMIPRIKDLAAAYEPEERQSIEALEDYALLELEISTWDPEDNTDPAFEYGGRMYQASCLIFLHTLMHGLGSPSEELYRRVEPCIDLFLSSFKELSHDSPPWTTFMWATLVAGSCMRNTDHRQMLWSILCNSVLHMRVVESTGYWLSLHWTNLDEDASAYGPYGLEQTMRDQGLAPCVG